MSRYNSFEDQRLDTKFVALDRRIRSLEAQAGIVQGIGSKLLRKVGADETYTSTSYVNVSGLNFTFVKKGATTLLQVTIEASGFMTAGGVRVDFGVDIVGPNVSYSDYDIAPFFFNDATSHRAWSYTREVPDGGVGTLLAAGNVTFQVQCKVSGSTFNTDANDLLVLKVTEAAV